MDVVVNDTNIFIDLFSIDLLNEFFALPLQIHTVDFVLAEIAEQDQIKVLQPFLGIGKLYVKKYSVEELQELVEFYNSCEGNVSISDCAVWQYAQTNHYRLLTGDKQLRKSAIEAGVSVSGILFVFDILIEFNIIPKSVAANKLEQLRLINKRLPKREIDERISHWRE